MPNYLNYHSRRVPLRSIRAGRVQLRVHKGRETGVHAEGYGARVTQ